MRIHGRGGQGVVTAAELLSMAAFDGGRFAQAFPSFGSERMGAPVTAFCRIDSKPIRLREPVDRPDAVVIQDPTLLHQIALFEGLADAGYVLVNTPRTLAELGIEELGERSARQRLASVPAGALARLHLGRPLANAALLGALSAQTGIISIEALEKAIGERFSGDLATGNAAAARAGFEHIRNAGAALAARDGETAVRRLAGPDPGAVQTGADSAASAASAVLPAGGAPHPAER